MTNKPEQSEPLQPGDIIVSPEIVDGHRLFTRVLEDGSRESGFAVAPDHPCAAHAGSYMQVGECVRPGVRRVLQRIPYTARASTGAASDAYRNGWDAVFGGRSAGGDGCNGSQAN